MKRGRKLKKNFSEAKRKRRKKRESQRTAVHLGTSRKRWKAQGAAAETIPTDYLEEKRETILRELFTHPPRFPLFFFHAYTIVPLITHTHTHTHTHLSLPPDTRLWTGRVELSLGQFPLPSLTARGLPHALTSP
mmetsp:Transcript_52113/g.102031  ORF Transcript_52113/g.102031 Transcript_52113/m.102031 type:complete len:134 (+) Transcript_52113:401-802(+)